MQHFLFMEKQITVLIADDNDRIRQSLKILLSASENIKLLGEATNGEEAIRQATELSPDVILMDINMAPVNGFEATRKIIKANPGARIIGLSLHRKSSYVRNMMGLGACGYVVKSDSYEKILEAIEEVATGKKYFDKNIMDE